MPLLPGEATGVEAAGPGPEGSPASGADVPVRRQVLVTAGRQALGGSPPTWPLIPYLPPLLLATVGTLVQVLVFATRVAYELTGLGVIPSPSLMVSEGLSSLLLPGEWQQWLQARVGWPGKDVAQSTVQYWENLNSGTQNAVIFATVFLTLGVFMTVVVAFYSSWAICWTKPARPDRQKEASHHGIRSYH